MPVPDRRAHATPLSSIAAVVIIVLAILLYDMAGGSMSVDPFYVKAFAAMFLVAGIIVALP